MLLDLVKGLKHLHDNGLCHLDIKPANIFIGLDGFTCKLGDFGLCVSIDSGFKDALEGDARYVAKELLKGQFGPKADIFSLGISLLELACDLDIPMSGETWHYLREGKLPNNFTKDLSRDLVGVLSWMMHPDPSSRPNVDQLLRHPCVRYARMKRPLVRTAITVVPKVTRACKWVFTRAWLFLLWIAAIVGLASSDKEKSDEDNTPDALSPMGSPTPVDEMFSDDEEDGSFSLLNGSPNRSWMDSVPVPYPKARAITPIPLDLTEPAFSSNSSLNSSCENSPIRTSVALSSSPAAPTGLSIISSSSRRFRTPDDHRSFTKSVGIEPRNLMEIFNDTAD